MKFSITSLLTCRARLLRLLCWTLFAGVAAQASALGMYSKGQHRSWLSRDCSTPAPAQYLAAVGVVPLRYAPPPEPATARPPRPEVKANPETASVSKTPASAGTEHVTATPTETTAPTATPSQATAPANPAEKPVSILPDDTPREVRPEDVLPYFQLPRGNGQTSGAPMPFAPASPTLPPSSATYELK